MLEHLVACDEVWGWVRSANAGDVYLVEPFYRFLLSDPATGAEVPCYAAPDLLVRPRGAPWHVVDWKCGRADGVIDQVLTYALAARDGLRLDLADGCVGAVVALNAPPEDRLMTFGITVTEIDEAAARLQTAISEARALLLDPVANIPMAEEAFPMTRDTRRCGQCAYRALCYPELYEVRC